MITIDLPSTSKATLSTPALSRFLNRARAAIPLHGDVEVLLAGDATLRRFNKDFRGKNQPTDVLSFPAPPEISARHAGDLAISLETAARQAAAYGHTLRDETKILLLHGLLHLSGYDHETDNGEMAAREASLRLQLRLPATLIERTQSPPSQPAKSPSLSPAKKSSSRPKAAPFAAAAERSPHSSHPASTSPQSAQTSAKALPHPHPKPRSSKLKMAAAVGRSPHSSPTPANPRTKTSRGAQ